MPSVMTYAPQDVVVTINSFIVPSIINVKVSWNAERMKPIRGIRGANSRVRSLDSSAVMELQILQTSPANDLLFQLLEQDLVYGTARLEVAISDTSGSLRLFTDEGFVNTYPEFEFSNGFNARVWRIGMLSTSAPQMGGNSKTATDFFNNIGEKVTSLFD